MTLYFIGLGLGDEKDMTVRGIEAAKKCDYIYFEDYTDVSEIKIKNLEKLFGKRIIPADRKLVEETDEIIKKAEKADTAFLVIGDALAATTHIDLLMRAKKQKIKTKIIHNASIFSAIGKTGLQIYKFGKTTSIPFPDKGFEPETPYDVLKENKKSNLHTLLLLDLRPNEKKFMTIKEAISILLKIESRRKEKVFTEKTFCVACSKLGSERERIVLGKAEELIKKDFDGPPYCLIIPAKLHFIEEEALIFLHS